MQNIVVARFENKRDADFIARMIKRYRKNAHVLKGEHWEDLYLGEMIEEGMKEKEEISEKEFLSFLDKKIKMLQ
ncbi:MAG: hypothetical protein ABIT08_00320 [Bacteroidia bacterium]